MSSENYIIQDKAITEDLKQFNVKKLNLLGWICVWIIAIVPLVIVLPFFQFVIAWVLISFTAAIVIAPLLWKKAGKSMLNSIFIKNFEDWKEKKEVDSAFRKLFNSFVGVKISEDYTYYLEGSAEDINLNSVKTLIKQRILNVTSASLGISFTIATILRFFIIESNMIMGIALILLLLSPLLLFWLIPMIWAIQDANIKYQDGSNDIGDLSYRISKSNLRNLIGIAGLTLAFSFFLDSKLLAESARTLPQRYIMASVWLALVIGLNLGVSFLCGSIYLNAHHENVVNEFRSKLANILDVGVTSVRKLSDSEKALYN